MKTATPIRDFGWNARNPQLAAIVVGVETIRFIGGLIAKDQSNRYSLLTDWHLPKTKCEFWGGAGTYDSELFHIEPVGVEPRVRVTIKAYHSTKEHNVCDGASMSPDSPKGVLDAAIMHDPAYYQGEDGLREFERIALFCGVKAKVVRKWFDNLFGTIVEAAGGKPWVARTYYRGIRTGYPIYNFFRPVIKLFCVFVFCVALSGCGGCQNYEYLFDRDEEYVPPNVEKECAGWHGEDMPDEYVRLTLAAPGL